ncbi:MAG: hypothetical protein QNK97_01065 [Gammaproteobacteria bacterium]
MSGAIAALAITVGTTAMGFIKAGKDKRAAEAAELTADIAMKEVEKALTKNEMAALSIQTEAYERESDALKTAAKTEMDSVREGDQRGVLAGSSRVQAGVTEAAGGQRTAMGQELMDLERLKADEETRKNDIGIQLKLGEVAGAQQAAAALSDSAAAGNAAAMQGVASAAMQGANMATASTYGESGAARKAERKQNKFVRQERSNSTLSRKDFNAQVLPGLQNDYQNKISGLTLGGTLPNRFVNQQDKDGVVSVLEQSRTDLSDIKDMTEIEFKNFMMELTPTQRNSVYLQMNQK